MVLLQLASGISSVVGVAFYIAAIVVFSTVGRRHRPDAYGWFLAWAIGNLFWMPVATVSAIFLPRIAGGIEETNTALGAITLLSAIVHAVLWLVFLRGFVIIAQPAKRDAAETIGHYR